MIELYGMSSPNVIKVIVVLEETGLAYELHYTDVWAGDQYQPEFRALNPNGKVPVMVDPDGPGGAPFVGFESGAILLYLAEKTGTLWPIDMRERHTVIKWLMFQMASIGPMFGQAIHFMELAPAGTDYARSRYVTEMLRLYALLDRRLGEQEFIAGSSYSLADIATFPWIRNMARFASVIGAHANVERWVAALHERPAIVRALAQADRFSEQVANSLKAARPEDWDRFLGRGSFARV